MKLSTAAAAMLLIVVTHLAEAVVVATQSGKLRGVSADATSSGVTVYRGIPYAAPPTGALR